MLKALFTSLSFLLCTLGYSLSANNAAFAQVTSDGTVNTEVNDDGKTAEITGGETRGDNLFHSFEDFSVKTGNEAFFNNADSISNIFSRVTGGNVSDINGAIRANGSASLFLINPAGIIFGEGASLNIGGSFYGSSASSILFEDGEFSATDLDNPPLLTVNAPIGLGFRDNPGDITNNSDLEVNEGENISLIGGDVSFDGGLIFAPAGIVNLGGLTTAGIVSFAKNGSLSFPEGVTRSDVSIAMSTIGVIDPGGGGSIFVNARNLDLTSAFINADIGIDIDADIVIDSVNAQAGNIIINATESVTLDNSSISNSVVIGADGNAGELNITTPNLTLANGGKFITSTFGAGNAGNITINATDISIDGNASDTSADENATSIYDDIFSLENKTGVFSTAEPAAEGNAGGIIINTSNLTLTNGGQVDASTFGRGNAGSVDITATDDITADGKNSEGFQSGVTSQVDSGAEGDAEGITISTNNLTLTKGGVVSASTLGRGNAGLVKIDADNILVDGVGAATGVASGVAETGVGNAGGIEIKTSKLALTNGGVVTSSTLGQGNAGLVKIDADNIFVDGVDSNGASSVIASGVAETGVGNAEGIEIKTSELALTNGGLVNSSTVGQGNAGNVTIDASKSIFISSSTKSSFSSGIGADAVIEDGNGGDINISTNQLTIANGSIEATNIDSSGEITSGTGQPGNIFIEANNLDLANTARIDAATQSPTGESGKIDLQIAEDITLRDNSFISAQAFKDADGGNLNIDARFIVAYPNNGTGNDLVATADQGRGGNINLNAEQIFGIETGEAINDQGDFIRNNNNNLDASSDVFGFDGSVNINISDINPVQGATELPSNVVEAKQATEQTCSADRNGRATNGLAIAGRGGVHPAPDNPLNSESLGNENSAEASIPEPIETSQGKIQPARGIMVTKSGRIVLTAYRTNNAGERILEYKVNCGQR
jgi:filamentous hemagglutinin family protein